MHIPSWLAAIAHRLNPRRSLAVATGWLIIVLTMGLAFAASQWAGRIVKTTLIEQHGLRLASASDYIASELDLAMSLRLQSVNVAASMLSRDIVHKNKSNIEHVLTNVQHSFPDFMWIGAADPDGQVIAATSEAVIGTNVHDYAWVSKGLIEAWVEEGLDLNTPRYLTTGEGQRFLNLTAPIRSSHGAVIGVVAARLNWSWLQDLTSEIDRGMSYVSRQEWLLIDRDNIVRVGPNELMGQRWINETSALHADAGTSQELNRSDLPARISMHQRPNGKTLLTATAQQQDLESLNKLGWRVVVLQPVSQLNQQVARSQWQIASELLALGGVAALLGNALVGRLTRRIRGIAHSADAIVAGNASHIDVPVGVDEAARLGKALERLLTNLQLERDDLKALNAALDQRVADRTEEIRRLAEDSRYSAVVRERLKIARDLHDTLAHSMMAMLTEIRLLKKLAHSRPEMLTDELDRAETAAHEGLSEARAAITQMRYNPARDIGLGAALHDLTQSFKERTGTLTRFELTPDLTTYSDKRAETLFRIAEESLRNIERHAAATQVTLSLTRLDDPNVLELSIEDNGVGFEVTQTFPGHYGLVGLHELADMVGASFSISSKPGQGTRVAVQMKIQFNHS